MTGKMKFLEGHDIHVLCESPSAWHLLDGYGLRLPGGPATTGHSLRSQFSVRMLTVLDLSLTIVQLIQVSSVHTSALQLLCPRPSIGRSFGSAAIRSSVFMSLPCLWLYSGAFWGYGYY